MNAIIFDTETNGRPLKRWSTYNNPEDWPRITQLSWITVDIENGERLTEHNYIVKPDGWKVPTVDELIAAGEKNPHFFEENNISTDRCESEGVAIDEVLGAFFIDAAGVDVAVAHNMDFDYNVVGAEAVRYDFYASKELVKICTMKTTDILLNIPGSNGPKYPTLVELHNYLFGCGFDGNHDALSDVIATSNCFIELKRRGHYDDFFVKKDD